MNRPIVNPSKNYIEHDGDKKVPYLPSDLPFNDDQKQWMGGFLAGLHSRLLVQTSAAPAPIATETAPARPIHILYGSQTGNSETVAEDAAASAMELGLTPTLLDMDDVDAAQLSNMERLLIVTSTYGEGEMPDNAQALWDEMSAADAPSLDGMFFSVLALGDTSYDGFCVAGKMWDERLAELGAERVADRVDCDVDFEAAAEAWTDSALTSIADKGHAGATGAAPATEKTNATTKPKSKYNRTNPLQAELITKRVLTGAESSKEIVHYEFSLADSGEQYNAGDALNVMVPNRPDLVDELLTALGANGDDSVSYQGKAYRLGELLSTELEIRTPSKEFVAALAERGNDEELSRQMENGDNEGITDYLWAKDSVDLLNSIEHDIDAQAFCDLSKPLAPRAYSISSSINKHSEEVHLTIGSVRYESHDRAHSGVCSTYLADIAREGDLVSCYFSPNKNFAVPDDNSLPIIMVGPGTGIAPFRAFLEEREARGADGDNWLFFGDRNAATDYIYREEIEAMSETGLLTKLDLAFSRDQEQKIYVQDRMRENGEELYAWLERGGYFYICGDAYRMAKDVDLALHQIIAKHGNMSESESEEYVSRLKKEKRYVRDVY